ncbi:sulfotransferase [Sphingopyxis sp. J-6]|uniref:sulfotransferase family protein n=1 Tax=Sphingopyxis sp. J-6 TaxID=3122054 RepID=UPI0039841F2A
MHGLAPPSRATIGDRAAIDVGLFLTGLAGEAETAARLGLHPAELRELFDGSALSRCTMMPVGVGDNLDIRFLDMAGEAFDAPTFDDSVGRARSRAGGRRTFSLPANAIAAAEAPRATPDGIILHVGRCGSTLLCNLLASGGDWIALREPECLNSLFLARAATRDPAAIDRIDTLAGQLAGCLAHAVRPRKSLVKLSSWTAPLAAPLLARFPGTPVIVVVRDPWQTVASFLAEPPHWYGPASAQLAASERAGAVRFFAEAWRSTVAAARCLPGERIMFVDYEDIVGNPAATLAKLRSHLGDDGPPLAPAALEATLASYSKAASAEAFDPSGKHRRAVLAPDLAEIVTAVTAGESLGCRCREAGQAFVEEMARSAACPGRPRPDESGEGRSHRL